MCLKNSSLLQGYMDKLHSATMSNTDNEVELYVDLNNKHNDINELKLEDEEIYTYERGPIIEEMEDVFVNVDDSFVKEVDSWKSKEVNDKEEYPRNNNSIESRGNETDSKISANSNAHVTDTTLRQPSSQKSFKCLTCSKSYRTKAKLQIHTRIHTAEQPYKCATCKKCFTRNSGLVTHMRTHTGEKPHECSRCNKCSCTQSNLVYHMRKHTAEKPNE